MSTLIFCIISGFLSLILLSAIYFHIKALRYIPMKTHEQDSVEERVNRLAMAMLQRSESNDWFYSAKPLTTEEQNERQRRWRNDRQRLLRIAREQNLIAQRPPSALSELNMDWKKLRASLIVN